jgi:hypothetical protein
MASLGITKTQGGNVGDPLTVAWKQAVQAQLQSEEDRIEALRAVHDGVVVALRRPVVVAVVCLIVCAASAVAVAALRVAEVFRG